MIVATAGHIDHGKTTLVRALTGVDTDRLPEEKARGISIDLGFAYRTLDDGTLLGFVDVPGHERFIRNMLAGVCAIDCALLVVAADDGVMPQTVEHLAILDLLGVPSGLVALTKCDRVGAERVAEVGRDLAARLAPTRLAGAPVFPVSAVTGAGVDALRGRLEALARDCTLREESGRHFRLAIDRAFTRSGSGTVVTGAIFNGAVKVGDTLVISPAGVEARVRSLQMSGHAVETARAGQRCAVNLAGAGLDHVSRGDWLLAPAVHRPTERLDVRLTVLPGESQPLRHWTPVHVHLGTTDVTGRLGIRRGEAIAPGTTATAQLILDHPVGALTGDRFIMRDQSASRTLGGGVVLDPFAPAARRSTATRAATLDAFAQATPADALRALVAAQPDGVDLGAFAVALNLTAETAARALHDAGAIAVGRETPVALAAGRRDEIKAHIVSELTAFHQAQPQATGMEVAALQAKIAARMAAPVFGALLRELADEKRLEVTGSQARLRGHESTSNPQDAKLWQAILPALEAAVFTAPTVRELADQLRQKEAVVKDLLYRKMKVGEVLRVGPDRFYPRPTMAALAGKATAVAQAAGGQFTAAQYRDAVGTGRTLAIEILEALDSLAVTQRIGDARRMRKDYIAVLGPAPEALLNAKPAAKPAAPPPRPAAKRSAGWTPRR